MVTSLGIDQYAAWGTESPFAYSESAITPAKTLERLYNSSMHTLSLAIARSSGGVTDHVIEVTKLGV